MGIPSWRALARSFAVAGLFVFAVCFVLAGACTAFGAPYWIPDYTTPPSGSVAQNSAVVQAYAEDDLSTIVSGSMTVNGFAMAPLVIDTASNPGLASVTFDPTIGGLLAYGTNNVSVSVTDALGQVATYSWSFTVAAAPTIGSVSPAPGAVATSTLKPPVTVTLVDPTSSTFTPGLSYGGSGYYFRVDGAYPTSGVTYNQPTKTYTYLRPLNWTNNSTHTVDFSAVNTAGLKVTYSWTFSIVTAAQVTFSSQAPAPGCVLTTSTVPVPFRVQASDQRSTFEANPADKFVLDGAALPAQLSYPSPSNHAVACLAATQTVLPDGTHTVTSVVQDALGLCATSTAWSFTVKAPPAASGFAPSPATASQTPVISAAVFDNGPGTAVVTMKVDGAAVASAYDPVSGIVSFTPGSPLSNNQDHTVSLTMTDAQGNTATQGWTFHVAANSDASFSSLAPAPGASSALSQPVVGLVATSAVNLAANQTKVHLDGALLSAAVTQPQPTQLLVSATAPTLLDGSHAASVSVTDVNGYTSTRSWSFSVAAPPALSAPIPDGGVSGSSRPPIGLWAADNSPGNLNVVLSVAGVQVYSGSVAQGAFQWVPASDLAPGTYPVHALVTDAAGNVAALDWGFTVQALGGMADAGACVNCHMGFPVPNHPNPTLGAACLACHDNPSAWSPANPDPWVAFHAASVQTSAHTTSETRCTASGCHDADLIAEHAGHPDASSLKFQCTTCHDSTDPTVKAAIAAGDTDCSVCHADLTSGHAAAHDTLTGPEVLPGAGGATCSACHDANLVTEHAEARASTAASGCAACHPTPRATVTAFDPTTCVQGGCHVAGTPEAMHAGTATAHALPSPAPSCVAAGCHAGSDLAALHSQASTVTATGTKTGCLVCHDAASVPASGQCASCHDAANPHGNLSAFHPATDSTSTACAAPGCHDTTDVLSIHAARPEGACAVCHANPTRGDLTIGKASADCDGCHTTSGVDYHTNMAVHVAPASDYDSCGHCHHGWGSYPGHGPDVTRHPAGCSTCHNANTTLPASTACENCHHAEGVDFHTSEPADHTPSDPVSVSCGQCHSTDVRSTHTTNGCQTCHVTYNCNECHSMHGADSGPGLTIKTTCANCHATLATSVGNHTAYVSSHTSTQTACAGSGCHVISDLAALHSAATTTVAGVPYSGCAVCHQSPTKQPTSSDCYSCHAGHGDITAKHTATSSASLSCGQCHGTSSVVATASMDVRAIHASDAQGPCNVCHNNSNPARVGDITTKTAECTACHAALVSSASNHTAYAGSHTSTQTSCAGSGCHVITDLAALHSAATTTVAGVTYSGCTVCHQSPTKQPTSSDCLTCHVAHGDISAVHQSVGGDDFVSVGMQNGDHDPSYGVDASCSECHITNLLALHVNNCGACHASTDPNVTGAIAARDTACTSCHPGEHQGGENTSHENIYDGGCNCHDSNWDDPGSSCTNCHGPYTPVPVPSTGSDVKSSYSGDASINLYPNDNVAGDFGINATYYVLDGATAVNGTQISVAAPATGLRSHTLKFWSTDWSGHSEVAHNVTFTVSHDSTPPVTTSDAAASYIGPATIHLSATDDSQAGVKASYYALDGSAATTGTGLTIAQPASGSASHTLKFWSTDFSGNVESSKTANFTITADIVPPHTTTTLPHYVSTNYVYPYFYPTDPAPSSGIAGVQMLADSSVTIWYQPWNSGQGYWYAGMYMPAGLHTLTFWAVDNAGNVENVETSTVIVDTIAPTTTSNAGSAYIGTASFSLTATDNVGGSGVSGTTWRDSWYTTSNGWQYGNWQTGTAVSVAPPASGTVQHTVQFYSVDLAGNTENWKTASFTVTAVAADTTPPSGTMSVNNGSSATSSTAANVNSAVTDSGSGLSQMRIDPGTGVYGSWVAYSASYGITLPSGDGSKTVNAQYKDVAGNVLTLSYQIRLDTVAPTGSMSVNNNASWASTTAASVNSTVTDAASGIASMSIDPGTGTYGAWVAYAASSTITLPDGDGTKTVRVQYKDKAGVVLSLTDTIVLDATPPSGSMSVNNNATYASSTAASVNSTVTDTGSGLSQIRIDPGTGTYGSWIAYAASSAITLPGGDGVKTVNVQYRDNAGVVSTLTDTIVLDQNAPVTTSDAVPTYAGSATVHLSASDAGSGVKATYYKLDGGAQTTGTVITTSVQSAHTLQFWSVDNSGLKEATKTANFTVTLPDTIPPVTTSDAQASYVGNATIHFSATDAGNSGLKATYFKVDGGAQTTGTVATVSGVGNHTVEFWSVDNANNAESPHNTANFAIVAGQSFTFTGADQYFTVPQGVTSINVDLYGGAGGDYSDQYAWGGNGGYVHATIPVTPGQVLDVKVGGKAGDGTYGWTSGAWPNGGDAENGHGAPGGGSTSIASVSAILAEAGAGGGAGDGSYNGGDGGYAGWLPGGNRAGGSDSCGGGGGWNGGSGFYEGDEGSADGGSSFINVGFGAMVAGVESGNGYAQISYPTSMTTIDTTPPITTSDAVSSYTSVAGISLTATDPAGWGVRDTYYVLDGGGITGGNSVYVTTNGSHTLQFWSVDNAGNAETAHTVSFAVNIPDTIPPATTSNAAAAYAATATISLSAVDDAPNGSGVSATYYRVDGGATQSGTTVVVGPSGTHSLEFWSVDNSNNTETHHTVSFIIDRTAPVTSSDAKAYYNGTANVTLTATDSVGGSGVWYTFYKVDGGTTYSRIPPTVVSISAAGSHTIEFWSYDTAGNIETHHTVTLVVDKTAPVTTSNAVASYNSTATITLTPSDTGGSGLAGTFYKLDGGVTTSGTVVTTGINGAHTLQFWSTDNAGNVEATKTANFTLTIPDIIPPTTTSNAAAAYNATATITLTATDNLGGGGVKATYFKLDGGATTTGTVATTGVVGSHTLLFWSVDNASNKEATNTATFVIDKTAPVTTSNAVASYVGTATITLTPTDAGGAGVKATYYKLDGGAMTTGTVVLVSPPAVNPVAHSLQFWSVDNGGNIESTHTVSFTVAAPDTIPPVTTSNAQASYFGPAMVTFTASDSGGAGVKATYYRLDGGATTTGTVVTVSAPASGVATHTIAFWSVDNSGNTESTNYANFSIQAGQVITASFGAGGPQHFTVPDGVTSLNVNMTGGQGGDGWDTAGGYGGQVSAVVPVTPGHRLTLAVGQWGNNGNYGGGYGGIGEISWGGGSSSIADGSTIMVEAGGGGGGSDSGGDGNPGGYQGWLPGGNQSAGDESGNGEGCGGGGGWNAGGGNDWGDSADGGTSYVAVGTGTLNAGANAGDGYVSITFTTAPDTIAPTTLSDAQNSYVGVSTITLLPADNPGGSGVSATHFQVDGGATQTGTSVPVNIPGSHSVTFWSTDWAGNVESPHTATYAVVIPDTIAPTTTSNALALYSWYPTISLYAADNPGGSSVFATYYKLDGGATTAGTAVPVNAQGNHTLQFWSVDYNGNVEATNTATFVVDMTPPTTTTNAKAAYNATATITLTPTDNVGGAGVAATYYRVDGGGWTIGTSVTVATVGTHTLYYESYDKANNWESQKWVTFVIDKTVPVTTSNATASYTGTATITLSPSDAGGSGLSATYYKVDAGTTTTGTSVVVSPPNIGSVAHTVYFWSTDNAGNVETTKSAAFTVNAVPDTTPPTTTSNAAASYATTATITLTASDGGGSGVKATYFKLDSGAVTTGTVATSGVNGSHTLQFWSVDFANNKETTKTATFLVDTLPPTTTSDAVSSYSGTATINLTANDNSGGIGVQTTYYQLDGGVQVTGTSLSVGPPDSGLATHTVTFWSVDKLGNTETHKSATFTVAPPGQTATLSFMWEPNSWAMSNLRVQDEHGNTIASNNLSGNGSDLDWTVTVPAGHKYYMVCDYYYQDDPYDEGGGYGMWSDVLAPNQNYEWWY